MPSSSFRPSEVEFLLTYIPEWKSSKTSDSGDKPKPGKISTRNRLVRRVIEEFYQQFPERDSHQTDKTPDTYSQDERDYLPTALTIYIQQLKKDSLHEYETFEDLAEKICNSASIDYADQDAKALAEMLEMFPEKMHDQVLHWGKTMPVHVFCMAVFATAPETALQSFL
ncbi:hypothetical protein FRC09_016332 [Ceratobasidium sp. 395]|nr:hypothetical protein FRC09_016332 [Ceratobasidium sp. 395]